MSEEIETGGPGAITVAGWRIYYGDGTVADSRSTDWEESPNDNVQVVVVFYNETYKTWIDDELKEYPYRVLYTRADYYWKWGAGSAIDANAANAPDVKLGKELEKEDWRAVYDRANDDLVFEN